MATPSEKLNKIFYNKYLMMFIPQINTLLTLIKQNKITSTHYDKVNNIWSIRENKDYLIIDNRPHWNITWDRLLRKLQEVPCKYYVPRSGDTVIDVGAGIGTESIIFSKLVKNGKIFSFEAHPDTFLFLKKIVKKNNISNISVHNVAITDLIGSIYIESLENHEANKVNTGNDISINSIPIKSTTLDNFVRYNELDCIDFLKMNIEGAEFEAMQGMQKSIKIIKNIAVSCHDFLACCKDKKIYETYKTFLKDNNFEIYSVNTGHPVRDTWIYGKNITC